MKLKKIENLGPGNPFLHDLYNMGHLIGKDLWLMYKNHPTEECPYIIIVNSATGERNMVMIEEEEKPNLEEIIVNDRYNGPMGIFENMDDTTKQD
jgi:hypothetical protein